jgi:putative membrane protein
MVASKLLDWLYRFVKGMFIGTGAILPGVSGGALAAVFGVYERIIAFLSDIRKNFWPNVLFFIPVALGSVFGMFVLAYPLDYFLQTAEIQVLWCFVGCIAGTLPALFREAGQEGRKPRHLVITVVTALVGLAGLWAARQFLDVTIPLNFGTWIMAGAIFALGMIVPGLSPSNFLMYFNMYEPMTAGIKNLDFTVILPLAIGAVICVLALAKLMSLILKKAYAGVFHFILGVVIASTAVIIPTDYSGATTAVYIVSAVVFLAGLALGLFMSWLDKTYKQDKN